MQGVSKSKFRIGATPGKKTVGAIELAAGNYVIYCDLAGHRKGGMEAKLVVS